LCHDQGFEPQPLA